MFHALTCLFDQIWKACTTIKNFQKEYCNSL